MQTTSQSNSRSATRPVSPVLSTVREQIEMNEELQARIQAIRDGEAKREYAPISLSLISGALAAIVAFTNKKTTELQGVVRNLRNDGRNLANGQGYGNTLLHDLVKKYEENQREYDKLLDGSSKRENLGVWLHKTYEETKSLAEATKDETIGRALKKYQKQTAHAYNTAEKIIGKLNDKSTVAHLDEVTIHADSELLKKARQLRDDIDKVCEAAYIQITSARQEYRKTIDSEVQLRVSRLGRPLGFNDLTSAGKRRSLIYGGAIGLAIGALVYMLVKFISREGKEEREERLALQATKEWEISQMQKEGKVVALEEEISAPLKGSERLQALAQQTAKTHTERLQEQSASSVLQR